MLSLDRFIKVALTVDNVIFGFDDNSLKVLLIKRGEEPYSDQWALPGYFVKEDEDLDTSAQRVLTELTGLEKVYLEQVNAFGTVKRHPSGRVVTVAYYSLIKISEYQVKPDSIAQKAKWHSLSKAMSKELAFDHNDILISCFNRLKARVRTRPVGFQLLPPKFTLTELQQLYEAILGIALDKRNFRKKILSMNLLIDLNEMQKDVAHRPAKLYRFDIEKYKELVSGGFNFEL
ncbi:MAG: NUDIX domain-containing protein [Saprospiraceae bacterium]